MAPPSTQFQCLRCGKCCRVILKQVGPNLINGMSLLPHEIGLFPHKNIYPMWGVGNKGKTRPRPKEIIAYQYSAEPCPHIGENNNCAIYDRRPIACRAYPLQKIGPVEIYDSDCSSVNLATTIHISFPPEIYAATRQIATLLITRSPGWVFDLSNKRWIMTRKVAEKLYGGDQIKEAIERWMNHVRPIR